MRTLTGSIAGLVCALVSTGVASAQFGRGQAEWTTPGGDGQRSSWIKTDPKISSASMQKPGFQFLWKVKFNNQPLQLNGLTPAVMLDRYIGYKGFRSLTFVGGSSDNVYGVDVDLGRVEWQTHLATAHAGDSPKTASAACPGGMTANLTRPATIAFPIPPAAGAAGRGPAPSGRNGPARSGVGEPEEGAVTIAEIAARAAAARGASGAFGARGMPGAPGVRGATGATGPTGAAPGGRGLGPRMPSEVYAIASDGALHGMYVSNGFEQNPPIPFVPPGANAQGLIVVNNVAYAETLQGCGGAPDAVWALDLPTKQVTSWQAKGGVAGAGGPAFGPDATLYVTTAAGDLAALEPKTLQLKNSYAAGQPFNSSPVIFQYKGKVLLAAATQDGALHLMDTAGLTPLDKTAASTTSANAAPAALATWQDAAAVRWILQPTAGAIASFKVVDRDGSPALEPAWVSRDLVSPLTPMIVNGVVFAVSSGEFRPGDSKVTTAQRIQRSTPAVLYALDGITGKELWSSGKTITSFVHNGGLASGGSQLYLGTYDGTLYTFGFWIEH